MLASVIVPIYNAEKYLKRCIDSILLQEYKEIELILVDDGSTDHSGAICDEYLLRDTRVKVEHKKNGGSASARNYGLKMAKGKYISFIDADDYIAPNFLKSMIDIAEENRIDIVQCNIQILEKGEKVDLQEKILEGKNIVNYYTNIEYLKRFCERNTYLQTLSLVNKLFKKELFTGLSFTEGKGIDDEYLICQLIYKAKNIAVNNQFMYYYIMTENSQMRSKPTLKRLDSIEVIEKQMDFFLQINQPELYNMIQYRYYSALIGGYNLVKRYFKEEKEQRILLKQKKQKFYQVLFLKEIALREKFYLIFKYYFYDLFTYIHGKVNRR